jgi:ppGpp synthetase/RelA/SpoT-type nucleotidyltranferase
MTTKKPIFEDFAEFSRSALKFDVEDKSLQNWINTNIETARSRIQQHDIVTFLEDLVASNQASLHRLPINIVSRDFQLYVKGYSSIVSKLYRANVLHNRRFEKPPKGGWITPDNMFGKINDLVRSTIVCRYIDEPAKIAQQIMAKAAALGLKASSRAQTKDEGYYAHHVYVSIPTSLMNREWQEFSVPVVLEIQITTEMQHMLYELTHRFYDKERNLAPNDDEGSWKWDYRSARFSASYLSHTLHMLEGMILQLYEDTEEKKVALLQPVVSPQQIDNEQPASITPSGSDGGSTDQPQSGDAPQPDVEQPSLLSGSDGGSTDQPKTGENPQPTSAEGLS